MTGCATSTHDTPDVAIHELEREIANQRAHPLRLDRRRHKMHAADYAALAACLLELSERVRWTER